VQHIRKFATRSAVTLLANAVLGLVGLASGVLAARLLGPAERGRLAAIQGWPVMLAALGMLGLQEAIVFFGAKRREDVGDVAASATLFAFAGGSLVTAVGWVAMPVLLSSQNSQVVGAARVYLLIFAVNALSGYLTFGLRAQQRWVLWNVTRVVLPLVWLIVLLGCWLLRTRDAVHVALAYLAAAVATSVVMFLLGHSLIGRSARPQARWTRPLFRFGIPMLLSTMSQTLNFRFDQLLMATLLQPDVLGVYAIAVAWSAIPAPVTAAIAAVLFPMVSAETNLRRRQDLLYTAVVATVVVGLTINILLALATARLLPFLFGKSFAVAVNVAYVLIGAGVFASMNIVLEEGLKGLGKARAVLAAELSGLITTVVLLSLLLKRLGAWGAAWTSLAAYGVTTLILLSVLVRGRGEQEVQASPLRMEV
jgi:O-antigen/teichoic acid export membrane protein